MKNYEYILSSLPALDPDWKFPEDASFATYVDWIVSKSDDADRKAIRTLLEGFQDERLTPDFYAQVLQSGTEFLRAYFTFDLHVRNAKARFLNKAFGRPAEQDTIPLETGEFAEAARLESVLATPDLLAREKGLDALMWDKISEITTFNYFDIQAVLGYIAKLHIISRWFELDKETGRELFGKLVDEVRGTFKGVDYRPEADAES